MIFLGLQRRYLNDLYKAQRNHWHHVTHRIVGEQIAFIPRHTAALIVIRLLTLVILVIAVFFSMAAFKTHVAPGAKFNRTQLQTNRETVESLNDDNPSWEELEKAGELALIGFYFILICQALVAWIVFCGTCYRCIKLKRPTRTWEVLPLCIGSTLLLIAGSLECYYATRFKRLDDELPEYTKKAWLIASIFTLIGSIFGIVDTCLLLGSEARIRSNQIDNQPIELEKELVGQA